MKKRRTVLKDGVKRAPMNVYRVSKKVQKDIEQLARRKGVAKWLLVERLLDSALTNKKFNAADWIKAG